MEFQTPPKESHSKRRSYTVAGDKVQRKKKRKIKSGKYKKSMSTTIKRKKKVLPEDVIEIGRDGTILFRSVKDGLIDSSNLEKSRKKKTKSKKRKKVIKKKTKGNKGNESVKKKIKRRSRTMGYNKGIGDIAKHGVKSSVGKVDKLYNRKKRKKSKNKSVKKKMAPKRRRGGVTVGSTANPLPPAELKDRELKEYSTPPPSPSSDSSDSEVDQYFVAVRKKSFYEKNRVTEVLNIEGEGKREGEGEYYTSSEDDYDEESNRETKYTTPKFITRQEHKNSKYPRIVSIDMNRKKRMNSGKKDVLGIKESMKKKAKSEKDLLEMKAETIGRKHVSIIDEKWNKAIKKEHIKDKKEARKRYKVEKEKELQLEIHRSIDAMDIGEPSDEETASNASSSDMSRKNTLEKINVPKIKTGDDLDPKKDDKNGTKIKEEIKKEEKVVPEKEKEPRLKVMILSWLKYKRNFEKKKLEGLLLALNTTSFLFMLYNVGTLSYRIGYENYTIWYFVVGDVLADLFYWITMLVHFVFKPYEFEESQLRYSWKYVRSIPFVVGVLYMGAPFILPVSWFFTNFLNKIFRLNKYFGILLLEELLGPLEKKLEKHFNMVYFRVVKYSFLMLIIIHIFSCLWYYIAKFESNYSNFIVPGPIHETFLYTVLIGPYEEHANSFAYGLTHFKQYLGSLYYGSYYIVGFAAPFPQDTIQSIYSCLAVLCGAGLFATLIGTVSSILNSLGRTQQMFNEKMGHINMFLKFKNVKKSIVKKITLYYDMLERKGRGMVGSEVIFNDLDIALKRKVNKSLHKDLVKKVQIFQECEKITNGLFIEDVCNYLKYILLLKGFTIVRHGEIGKTMYFISKGEVDIVSKDGVKWATLGRGDFFGEIALFLKKNRTANVIAKTNCELYELHGDDLNRILQIHSHCKVLFRREAKKRYLDMKDKEKRERNMKQLKKGIEKPRRRKRKAISTIRTDSTSGVETPKTKSPKNSATSRIRTSAVGSRGSKNSAELIKSIRNDSRTTKRKSKRVTKFLARKKKKNTLDGKIKNKTVVDLKPRTMVIKKTMVD